MQSGLLQLLSPSWRWIKRYHVAGCLLDKASKRTDGAADVEEAVDRGVGEADAVGAVHAAAQVAAAQEWHRQAAQCATRTVAAGTTCPCKHTMPL